MNTCESLDEQEKPNQTKPQFFSRNSQTPEQIAQRGDGIFGDAQAQLDTSVLPEQAVD